MGIPPPSVFGYRVQRARRSTLLVARAHGRVALALCAARREPLGLGDAGGARFRGRQPIDRPRSGADPHRRVRHLGGGGGARRRRVRVDQRVHQPGVVSVLPVDPVPARGDGRRRRSGCWARWSARSSWCCCPSCCRRWRNTACCSSACCCCSCCGSRRAASSGWSARFFEKPPSGRGRRGAARRRGLSGSGRAAAADLSVERPLGQLRRRACGERSSASRRGRARSPASSGRTAPARAPCSISSAASIAPTAGAVRLGEREICWAARRSAIAQRGLARTYQTTQLFGDMSVHRQRARRAAPRPARRVARCSRPSATPRSQAIAESLLAFVGYRGPLDSARGRAAACRQAPGRDRARARDPRPACCCSTSRPPGSTPPTPSALGELLHAVAAHRHHRAAGRARHEAGDGHVGPCRGARCRRQDRRRHAGSGCAPIRAVLKAYLGAEKSRRSRRASAARDAGRRPCWRSTKLGAGYGAVNVLRDVDLSVEQGELRRGAGRERRRQIDPDARAERA